MSYNFVIRASYIKERLEYQDLFSSLLHVNFQTDKIILVFIIRVKKLLFAELKIRLKSASFLASFFNFISIFSILILIFYFFESSGFLAFFELHAWLWGRTVYTSYLQSTPEPLIAQITIVSVHKILFLWSMYHPATFRFCKAQIREITAPLS